MLKRQAMATTRSSGSQALLLGACCIIFAHFTDAKPMPKFAGTYEQTGGNFAVEGYGSISRACVTNSSASHQRSTTRMPRCIYVDLGAHTGDTYRSFLNKPESGRAYIGNMHDGSGTEEARYAKEFRKLDLWKGKPTDPHDCIAYLFEANQDDYMTRGLQRAVAVAKRPHHVHIMRKAALDHDGNVTFKSSPECEVCGSAATTSKAFKDQVQEEKTVEVQGISVPRFLAQVAQPEDFVILKMDIEGAERDVLPCLARSPAAPLVDVLLIEPDYFAEMRFSHLPPAEYEEGKRSIRAAINALKLGGTIVYDWF